MVRRTSILVAALVAGATLSTTAPGLAQKITHKENDLLAAGFTSRPADNPQRAAMLARLPNKKFVRRVHGDRTAYVYADAKNCDCLYVGTEQAYGRYRRQEQAKNIADEQQFAAMDYNDASWNWGAWGPWGGPWGGFGFGPGIGW